MRVSIVVAASTNNVIGRQGRLPWHIPEDLRRFRQLTIGKPVVMGRRTYESIGRPLAGRRNIVVSGRQGLRIDGCEVAASPEEALRLAAGGEEVMVIGGERVYAAFLPRAECIHMTRVHVAVDGDAFFPEVHGEEWELVWSEERPATGERPVAFTFERLERMAR